MYKYLKQINWPQLLKAASITLLTVAVLAVLWTGYLYFSFSAADLELVSEAGKPVARGEGVIQVEYLGDPANQVPVEYADIPQHCVNALVAAEDRTFFTNPGFNFTGLLRGVYDEFARGNYGGSSITHQVIKIGTSNYFDRGFGDKYFEVIAGVKLNNELSKEEIMQMYMNNVYLGNFNYGIGAAALNYFNKEAKELTLAECAYIMGLPQQPSLYHPFKRRDLGVKRQVLVLSYMLQNGYITSEELKTAVNQELKFGEPDILLSDLPPT